MRNRHILGICVRCTDNAGIDRSIGSQAKKPFFARGDYRVVNGYRSVPMFIQLSGRASCQVADNGPQSASMPTIDNGREVKDDGGQKRCNRKTNDPTAAVAILKERSQAGPIVFPLSFKASPLRRRLHDNRDKLSERTVPDVCC